MKRLMLLGIGAAVGYVLGARAGRERYEQMAQAAGKAWQGAGLDKRTREVSEQAAATARQAGEWVAGSASGALGTARDAMAEHTAGASTASNGAAGEPSMPEPPPTA